MFDGSYRTKRTVNLSGNSRRNRNRRSTLSSSSSTSGTNKERLLEEAKIKRQERLLQQKKIDSVTKIQRTFRGFQARWKLVQLLSSSNDNDDNDYGGKFYDPLITISSRSNNEERMDDDDSEELIMASMRRISRRLSPSLIPMLSSQPPTIRRTTTKSTSSSSGSSTNNNGGGTTKMESDRKRKRIPSQVDETIIWNMMLTLEESITKYQQQHQQQQQNKAKHEIVNSSSSSKMTNMQRHVVLSRIFYQCIRLLIDSLHDYDYTYSQEEQIQIRKLVNVIQYIFQISQQQQQQQQQQQPNSSSSSSSSQDLLQTIWNLNGLTMDGKLRVVVVDDRIPPSPVEMKFIPTEGEEIIQALFTCFRSWFCSSFQVPPPDNNNNSTEEGSSSSRMMIRGVTELIMHWTFRAVVAERNNYGNNDRDVTMNNGNQDNNNNDDNNDGNSVMSVLAAILFCSSEIKDLESRWNVQLHQCFHSYLSHYYSQHDDGTTTNATTPVSIESLYGKLIQGVIQTLSPPSVSSSSLKSNNDISLHQKRRDMLLSHMVRTTLLGKRTLMFLSNALEHYSKALKDVQQTADEANNNNKAQQSNEREGLCVSIVNLMNVILLPGKNGSAMDREGSQILGVMCGLAAKGEDVVSLLSSIVNVKETEKIIDLTKNSDNSEEEDDDDMEDIMDGHLDTARRQNQTTATYVPTRRVTKKRDATSRQEIQTVSKLDTLYQSEVLQAHKEALISLHRWVKERNGKYTTTTTTTTNDALNNDSYIPLMGTIAKMIGEGDLILKLSSVLFRNRSDQERSSNSSYISGQEAFVRLISYLLQYCTSTKSKVSAKSPLLSKLAFSPGFVDELWIYVEQTIKRTSLFSSKNSNNGKNETTNQALHTSTALSVLSDLYVQRLLAIDDEEFLLLYTAQNSSKMPSSRINAQTLVVIMRDILYELYWSKPVIASDVMAPTRCWSGQHGDHLSPEGAKEQCQNIRLILSGTKLWNALYERWSRLFRSAKFCEEECWWFPHLAARDDGVNAIAMAGGGDAMDVDEDSDSDDMDLDMDFNQGSDLDVSTPNQMSATEEENETLASFFKDPKMARILTSIPQSVPFARRAKLFSSLLKADKAKSQDESSALHDLIRRIEQGDDDEGYRGKEQIVIHRDTMYDDAKEQLDKLGQRCKKKIQVSFINQHGANEAGIDGGGLFKEFLSDLIKLAFDPDVDRDNSIHPLFTVSPMQTLRVNTGLRPVPLVLSHYAFLGRVLGKAVYESILVEPQFCLPFLNQLLGKHNTLDDLKNVDPDTYRNLSNFRKMSAQEINDVGSTFELTTPRTDGTNTSTVELIPGGSTVPVTQQNVIRYVHLLAYRRLNIETSAQTRAFLQGFRDLIPAAWVRLFSPYELQKVIGGDDSIKGFDVKGLKKAMEYGSGYHPSQPIIQWFWEVLEEMTPEQQRNFLKFMTSCSRQPLLGFSALNPPPCIQQIRLSEEDHTTNARLPTSSTCMNLLKLPNYPSKEMLKEKLLYAVQSGAGFELS